MVGDRVGVGPIGSGQGPRHVVEIDPPRMVGDAIAAVRVRDELDGLVVTVPERQG